MHSPNATARITGLIYLVIVALGIFTLRYVPAQLIVDGDPDVTLSKIMASEALFRVSIFLEVLSEVIFLGMVLLLYKLLNPVHKLAAITMVVLAATGVMIVLVGIGNKFAILTLLDRSGGALGGNDLPLQVWSHLSAYDDGITAASLFWGLWLLPFGYLVYRSGFLPKILGIVLIVGCFGYVVNFGGIVLVKNYGSLGLARYITAPASLGELAICLWMLILGARSQRS